MHQRNLSFVLPAIMLVACAGPRHAAAQPPCTPADAPAASSEARTTNTLEERFRGATALLYGMTEDGSYRMLCTATAFEREGNTYRFVTAAHCLAEDDTNHERVEVEKTSYFITFDERRRKSLQQVEVVGVGYQHRGGDFAVVQVELEDEIPVIPLADHDPRLGEEVSNFASPLGLGKQLFRGHVSMEFLDRPVVSGSINWRGATLVQMSSGPGSSGSALVSTSQNGIVAFLVGSIGLRGRGSPNIVTIPVSKFKSFWNDVKAGNYRWYRAESSESGGSSSAERNMVERIWRTIHREGGRSFVIGGEDAPRE